MLDKNDCEEGILLIVKNILKHNAVTGLSEQELNLEKQVEEQL
jgi:hypothetical protein